MEFKEIQSLIQVELDQTDLLIHKTLTAGVELLSDISRHLIDSGGKRIRPLLVLLISKALNYQNQSVVVAAAIEFLHASTLLHDDVIDVSSLRRGQPTANVVWGNSAAVLGGDFLYSRAIQLLLGLGSIDVLKVLSEIYSLIIEGEMRQLVNCHNPDIDYEEYLRIIDHKTAKLFEASCVIPAMLANASVDLQDAFRAYGHHLGLAFQIVDDMLDYTASAAEMGKNTGDDLIEGKTTLPLIYAMQLAEPEDARLIHEAIREGKVEALSQIQKIIQSCGALDKTLLAAKAQADLAEQVLSPVPESESKAALIALARQSIKRRT